MKAAVITEPFHIQIQDMPIPELKPDEALLAVKMAGICGSDLHFYDGTHPYAQYPHIYGHELAGSVMGIGADVTKVKPGDRVVVEPSIPCGACYPCRSGKYNCCANMRFVGAFGRQGGFAQYVAVPEACLHLMPGEMDFDLGALCEPFSIGAQAVIRSGVKNGDTVTILGVGPIGLTILILLKHMFQVKVFAVDVVRERLDSALAFGADIILNPKECDLIQTIGELTNGENSNIVIEVAGLKQTMEQTIQLVSSGGRIVIVGLTNDEVVMPGILFTKKEVEIYGSRNSAGQFPFIIEFLNGHQEIARRFITKTMDFDSIAEAFEIARSKPMETNKIMIKI